MVGSEIREYRSRWSTPDGFETYVQWLRAQALADSPQPEGFVPSTILCWVDGAGLYRANTCIRSVSCCFVAAVRLPGGTG